MEPKGGVYVTYSSKACRLTGIYSPSAQSQQTDFYRPLENFLVASKTLVMLGDYNVILDARLDRDGSAGRRFNSCFIDLLKCSQLAARYRLEHPSLPV